jgi:hypothetical protein
VRDISKCRPCFESYLANDTIPAPDWVKEAAAFLGPFTDIEW